MPTRSHRKAPPPEPDSDQRLTAAIERLERRLAVVQTVLDEIREEMTWAINNGRILAIDAESLQRLFDRLALTRQPDDQPAPVESAPPTPASTLDREPEQVAPMDRHVRQQSLW